MGMPSAKAKRSLTLPKKLLFASITTVGFFLLFEACLAFFGVRAVTETGDPFIGFSSARRC